MQNLGDIRVDRGGGAELVSEDEARAGGLAPSQ